MNSTIVVIEKRRSVRKYLNKPIPKDILRELVNAGRLAPTARNDQPWEFIVITDKKLLETVGEKTDHGKFIKESAACIVVCCRETKYLLEDGCAATENIILAAESFDVSSCWVAGHKKAYCEEIKKTLGIPDELIIISLIPLGYADESEKNIKKSKRSLDEVIHWEKF